VKGCGVVTTFEIAGVVTLTVLVVLGILTILSRTGRG
jgi:hypothetical protein